MKSRIAWQMRQMADLHETITIGSNKEIDVAQTAERIVGGEAAEGHYCAFGGAGRLHRIEDVRRAPGAADRDDEIVGACIELDLLGENPVVAEIIAQAGQHRSVIERHRAHVAVLRIIGRHVARDGGAAAVADKYELVAGGVDAARERHDLVDRLGRLDRLAGGRGHRRLHEISGQGREIAPDLPAVDLEIELGHDLLTCHLISPRLPANRAYRPIIVAQVSRKAAAPRQPCSTPGFRRAGRAADRGNWRSTSAWLSPKAGPTC